MPRTRGAWAFWLTVFALCWCVLVLARAFVAAAYSSGETLVEANGLRVAWFLAIPVVLTLAAGAGLWLANSRGSAAGTTLAWTALAALAAGTFLTALSIGAMLLPAVLLLAAAVALTPDPDQRAAVTARRR